MNCVITQPNYIPWSGHFHLIYKAEVVVFFDTVQYTKKSWRTRNRVKGEEGGSRWLTIPVHAKDHQKLGLKIKDVEIDWRKKWNEAHRQTLHQIYRKAPHYDDCAALLDEIYAREDRNLADFTIDSTIKLAGALGIEGRRYLRSSELDEEGEGTDRVISIMRQIGCDHLVNGPTAREYTDHEKLAEAGLTVEYMDYGYPEYPQMGGGFDANLSILDLMIMTGSEAPAFIWENASEAPVSS